MISFFFHKPRPNLLGVDIEKLLVVVDGPQRGSGSGGATGGGSFWQQLWAREYEEMKVRWGQVLGRQRERAGEREREFVCVCEQGSGANHAGIWAVEIFSERSHRYEKGKIEMKRGRLVKVRRKTMGLQTEAHGTRAGPPMVSSRPPCVSLWKR